MTSYNPVIKNSAGGALLYVALRSAGTANIFQSNPTLAAGDVKISIDGGALANLGTLPAVTPASSKAVKVTLSQSEVNGDNLFIIFSDAAGAEWCDLAINIQTVSGNLDSIYSDTTHIDLLTGEGDFSDILSRLVVTNSQMLIVKSDTSDIRSNLAAMVAAAGILSDINSGIDVIQTTVSDIQSDTNVVITKLTEVDTSDILSLLTLIRSDTTVIEAVTSDIQSDTNVLITKMRGVVLATGTIGATGNTTTVVHVPDTVLDSLSDDEIKNYNIVLYDNSTDEYHVRTITAWTNTGDLATVSPAFPFTPEASVDLYWILPPVANQFDGDLSDVLSRLTVHDAIISDIQSDTNKLVSDATEVDTSDILSLLTLVRSDTTHIESDAAAIELIVSDIQSDTNKLVSDATEVDTSDILSLLTLVRSDTAHIESDAVRILSDTNALNLGEGDISDILSRLVVTNSQLLIVKSDTSDIRSHIAIWEGAAGLLSDINSGVDVIQTTVSDIQSDTNVLITKMRGVVLATGTIGATGNTTTVVHVPDTVLDSLSDDEIKNYNIVLYDNSTDEYHVRTITAWTNTGDLATVSPAFPFTPEASVDLYWILPPFANQFDGDISDVLSLLTAVQAVTSDIQSDTNVVITKLTEADTSDILSLLTLVRSDTAHIESDAVRILSDTTRIDTLVTKVDSDQTSQLAFISDIQSDTNKLVSDATEVDTSDILSLLTLVRSDTAHIESDAVRILSDTNALNLGEGDVSDILSRLVVTNSQLLIVKSDTSDIRSALVIIASDTAAIEAAGGSLTVAQASQLSLVVNVYSDTTFLEASGGSLTAEQASQLALTVDIYSDTTAIEAAGGSSLTSDQDSKLTRVANAIVEVDTSDLMSMLTLIRSDTAHIESDAVRILSDTTRIDTLATRIDSDQISQLAFISDIQSDTNKLVSDATEVDTSDILSLLTLVRSDTTHIESQTTRIHSDTITLASDLAEGDFSDILSRLVVTNSQMLIVKSDTSDIRSALVIIASDLVSHAAIISDIQSDTNKLVSDATEVDASDILSLLTLVRSDTAHIESDAVRILSDTTRIDTLVTKVDSDQTSQLAFISDIQSDTNKLVSDATEVDTSDILSLLTLVRSDTAHIESDAALIETGVDNLPTNAELATALAAADDAVLAAIAALNNLSAAQVNAQVVDALSVDTYAEPGQGTPAATESLAAKIGYLYKAWRNKKTQSATTHSLFADGGATVDQKGAVSDDGSTATRGEIASGP